MAKQETLEKLAGHRVKDDAEARLEPKARVLAIFEDHYRLGLKTMPPRAALATAYTAAANYLESIGSKPPAGGDPAGP